MTKRVHLYHIVSGHFRLFGFFVLSVLISAVAPNLYAQAAEDSVRVEREGPEQPEEIRHNTFLNTPFQSGFPKTDLNRYQINDFDSNYNFFRRLRHQTVEDFILGKEEGFNRYGAEWEQMINENLMAILEATFKEKSDFFLMLSRVAPFLGISFYEPYIDPVVPRTEDPDVTPRQP